MEKISGILPASRRVSSGDVKEAPPARPGAPAFGRAEGSNSIRDRVSLSSAARVQDIGALRNYEPSTDAARARIVEQIAEQFFEGQGQSRRTVDAVESYPNPVLPLPQTLSAEVNTSTSEVLPEIELAWRPQDFDAE